MIAQNREIFDPEMKLSIIIRLIAVVFRVDDRI